MLLLAWDLEELNEIWLVTYCDDDEGSIIIKLGGLGVVACMLCRTGSLVSIPRYLFGIPAGRKRQ
jgi:hypothetical protein